MAESGEGSGRATERSIEDITESLDKACAALHTGQLVHAPSFTLADAMSAVELMEPKMDADMAAANAAHAQPESYYLAPSQLDSEQLVDVADGLIKCEATWHEGFPLAQTVLTCLYLHDPSLACGTEPASPLLEALVRFTAATVHAVHSVIIRADIYEEEDFVSNLYDFSFQSHENEGSTLALSSSLKTAEQWMQACSQGKVRSDDTQNANAYLSRVFPRLKLRVNMHEALAALEQPDSKSMQTANMYLKRARQQVALMQSQFQEQQHADASLGESNLDDGVAASIGFDPDVNKDLIWPSPPRRTPILAKHEALERIDKHLADLQQVCILKDRCTSLSRVLDFLVGFNAGAPGILARSRMFLTLWESETTYGQIETIDLVLQSAFAPLAQSPPALQGDEAYEDFADKAANALVNQTIALCSNQARTHRNLRRSVGDWKELLPLAQALDRSPLVKNAASDALRRANSVGTEAEALSAGVFEAWTVEFLNRTAMQQVELCAQLDLLMPHEYALTYEALSNIIRAYKEEYIRRLRCAQQVGVGTGSDHAFSCSDVDAWQQALAGRQRLALASAQIAAALPTISMKELDTDNDLSAQKTRFTQRFKYLRESPLESCIDFSNLTCADNEMSFSLTQARESFGEAQQHLSAALENENAFHDAQREDLSSLLRLAKANENAISSLQYDKNQQTHYGASEHSAFPQLHVQSLA